MRASSRENDSVTGDEDHSGVVLVACKDERSCMQLEDFIKNGPQKVFSLHLFTLSCHIMRFCLLSANPIQY